MYKTIKILENSWLRPLSKDVYKRLSVNQIPRVCSDQHGEDVYIRHWLLMKNKPGHSHG